MLKLGKPLPLALLAARPRRVRRVRFLRSWRLLEYTQAKTRRLDTLVTSIIRFAFADGYFSHPTLRQKSELDRRLYHRPLLGCIGADRTWLEQLLQ